MTFQTIADAPKRKLTFGKILLALLFLDIAVILGLAIVAYLPQNHSIKDDILGMTFRFNIVLIIIVMMSAVYYVFFRNKKRSFVGTLELQPTEIILNSKNYPVSAIKHIRFVGNDILGDFRGYETKGNNNEIFLELQNGEKISSSFQQTTAVRLKDDEATLREYLQLGLLSESNLDTILNNTNYY